MKSKLIGMGILALSLIVGASPAAMAKEPPVAKLVQVEGKVEYSRNGKTWRPVRQTKYLFSNYMIRTGSNGSGKLINQAEGTSQRLGPNSEIMIEDNMIQLVAGNLSKPKEESTSIWQALANKFAKAQRYTTVRRGIPTCDTRVRTARELVVSGTHPEIVWRNACPENSYKLVLNGETKIIPAQSTSEMIRYSVADLGPGEYSYRLEVLENGDTVFSPSKDSSLRVLSDKEEKAVMKQLKAADDDVFVATEVYESNGMLVAAMDAYRGYFADNPDDNDMRPLLIKAYQDLKLSDLKDREARLYNSALEDDY